ncbi:hypothetical protein Lfu02_27930 [Longispora fulva]|uniref:Putative nucleic acid-binding Zn-ribbon protein n=1 Tax=Longispora fulva TaxID=619741 RepID=A0A8J7GUX0_9ACTN|nr:hypothetical protein [Longispora fulva]MBG6138929.1 putative nucleic acid-binding Zn-ribbon protein [Longispora fulva]GIG58421.1 hypothetical protein Lfu02_27930 [Longispora fulva]
MHCPWCGSRLPQTVEEEWEAAVRARGLDPDAEDDLPAHLDWERAGYRRDSALLAAIGAHLAPQVSRISVRLPRQLADDAVAAWHRDDEGDIGEETPEQAAVRDHAAYLALIGLVITQRGVADGDEVVVDLDVTHVGAALRAAEG